MFVIYLLACLVVCLADRHLSPRSTSLHACLPACLAYDLHFLTPALLACLPAFSAYESYLLHGARITELVNDSFLQKPI